MRRLLQAADAHAAAAAAAPTSRPRERQRLQLDVSSCRGLERDVRQAASQGMQQLRAALGLQ